MLNWKTAENKSSIANFTSDPDVESFKIQQRMDNSIEQRIASSYCQIKGCKDIACSSISGDTDPGTVATDFIENYFKVHLNSNCLPLRKTFTNAIFTTIISPIGGHYIFHNSTNHRPRLYSFIYFYYFKDRRIVAKTV